MEEPEPSKEYDKPLIYNQDLDCIEKSLGNIEVIGELKAALIKTPTVSIGNGTYITDPTNPNYRMHLTSHGIELEHRTETTSNDIWEIMGRFIVDKYNNLVITNADEDDLPKLRIFTPDNGAHIYHLNGDYLDSKGDNTAESQGLSFDGDNLVHGEDYPLLEDNSVHEGKVEAECGDRDVLAFTSADWALVGDKWVNLDDGSTKLDTSQQAKENADAWNEKGMTEYSTWGMSGWTDIFDWRID